MGRLTHQREHVIVIHGIARMKDLLVRMKGCPKVAFVHASLLAILLARCNPFGHLSHKYAVWNCACTAWAESAPHPGIKLTKPAQGP